MLFSFNQVSFGYDDNLILKDVNFAVNEGERVGLIGANGEGKTTLIKLVLGQLDATYGQIIKKSGVKIGYLEQSGGYESNNTVYQEALLVVREKLNAVEKLNALALRLSNELEGSHEYAVLSAKMESLNKYIAANDCYNAEVKVKTVLNGMGFENGYDQVIDTMSGGEKTRFKLARLLIEEPDLLVLDEPTNHLDIKTLYWLEEYLSTFKGAIFIVSHDRYFLDKIINRTLEIENRGVCAFSGNYSKYKILKAAKVELEQKEYEKQQEEIAKLEDYIARNLVRASTTKMAQSRRTKLEKMDVLQKPYVPPKPPKFLFTYDISPYERVLNINNLTLTAGEKTLIQGGNLSLTRGKKLAIVGENGTGKSTLIKAISSGKNSAIELGRFVRIAVYDQEHANLNLENTVLAELWERHVGFTQTEVRSALARCGLCEEDIPKQVKSLSGGERAKLALCVFESERGNVLILDEPTNHLDLPARESLEGALKTFDGTVIFVSHDRYFISAIADCVVEIEDKKLNFYEGGYESYNQTKKRLLETAAEQRREEERRAYEVNKQASFRSKQERAEEVRRKNRAKQIEADICRVEEQENYINCQLSNPEVLSDYTKVAALSAELEELKRELDALYEEYETLI